MRMIRLYYLNAVTMKKNNLLHSYEDNLQDLLDYRQNEIARYMLFHQEPSPDQKYCKILKVRKIPLDGINFLFVENLRSTNQRSRIFVIHPETVEIFYNSNVLTVVKGGIYRHTGGRLTPFNQTGSCFPMVCFVNLFCELPFVSIWSNFRKPEDAKRAIMVTTNYSIVGIFADNQKTSRNLSQSSCLNLNVNKQDL